MKALISLSTALLLSACATTNGKIIPSAEASVASADSTYVFGEFILEKEFLDGSQGYLEITHQESGQTFSLKLRSDRTVYAVEIPPGEYSVNGLVITDVFSVIDPSLNVLGGGEAFSANAGQVVYIGRHILSHIRNIKGTQMIYLSKPGNASSAIKQLDPSFEKLKFMASALGEEII